MSTRRVDGLVQALDIERLSKSQVSRMAKELDVEVTAFHNRPLDAAALHLRVARRVDPEDPRG